MSRFAARSYAGGRIRHGRTALPHGFFCNATATPEIYTLSLHDALPISPRLAISTERNGHVPVAMSRIGLFMSAPVAAGPRARSPEHRSSTARRAEHRAA